MSTVCDERKERDMLVDEMGEKETGREEGVVVSESAVVYYCRTLPLLSNSQSWEQTNKIVFASDKQTS